MSFLTKEQYDCKNTFGDSSEWQAMVTNTIKISNFQSWLLMGHIKILC